jgi:hypothetical protein
MLETREVRRYLPGVEWKDGELGRRTADEAGEEKEIFCVGQRKRLTGLLPGETAERQAGIDLERDARSGRERADSADSAGADEEGLPPARLSGRRDHAHLQLAQPLEPAQALDDVLEGLDPVSEACRLLVAKVVGEMVEPRPKARQRTAVEETIELVGGA